MSLDVKKLTDEELAFLLYAAEEEEDEEGFYRFTTTAFCCTGLRIKRDLEQEYNKRELNQNMFFKDVWCEKE